MMKDYIYVIIIVNDITHIVKNVRSIYAHYVKESIEHIKEYILEI